MENVWSPLPRAKSMKLILAALTAALLSPLGPTTAPSGGGTVKGKIVFQGEAPRRRKVDMGSDPTCHKLHAEALLEESVIVGEKGELANVFVWVSKGLEGKTFAPPSESAVLDQKGCC